MIGINTIFKIPKTYSRVIFKKTPVEAEANAGINLLALKRHGGWKSSEVAT